jgi:porphobilinogen synthase
MSEIVDLQNTTVPGQRPRRLRRNANLRRMVRETSLTPADFIFPLFVRHGRDEQRPIPSMPGQFQYTVDRLPAEVRRIAALGIPAVVLFGIPAVKDRYGSGNYDKDGVVPKAIEVIKDVAPELIVISDMCFCEYTDHGHCGVVNFHDEPAHRAGLHDGYLLNDPTLALLARASVVHAQAGADIIAPSGMIDGMVGAIREALDQVD